MSDLETMCRKRAPSFEILSQARGKGWVVQLQWVSSLGVNVYVQKGLPDGEHALMWQRLMLQQVLGDRGLLG